MALQLAPDGRPAVLAPETRMPGAAARWIQWPMPARGAEFPVAHADLRGRVPGAGAGPRAALAGRSARAEAVPASHPLHPVKARADAALREFYPLLAAVRRRRPRGSMNVKWVLHGQLLISLYGIPSDRDFCARLVASTAFRWFLDMRPGDLVPDWWEFARERRSVADTIVGRCFLAVVLAPPGEPRTEVRDPVDAGACLAPS